ncbi:MAG: hypothetical protein U1E50_11615 [Caulobacteraceae bacterium]
MDKPARAPETGRVSQMERIMRLTHGLFLLAAPVLLLAACQKPAAKPSPPEPPKMVGDAPVQPPAPPELKGPTGFHHQGGFDAQGFYMPVQEVRVGALLLDHIGVGSQNDFEQWEKGDREGVYGPILLQFDDTTSPVIENEMGGEVHSVNVRILPTAYNFDSHTLSFAGTDAKLGKVVFEARFDGEALRRALESGESAQVTVLRGTLVIGAKRFENVSLTYFAGD